MNRTSPEELLKTLIAIPSVNPEDTDDPAITGEARMADAVGDLLESRGFRVALEEQEPGRPNVIAESVPDDGRPTVLIEVHLDTVSIAGMSIDPFDPVERDGRIYGRGACDNKGPLAASLSALTLERVRRLTAAGVRIVYVGAMGEEKGNQGAKHLVETGRLQADQVLVLEPTELEIVHAHKGVIWFVVEVLGRAGHGSDPGRCVNAIDGMVEVIQMLHDMTGAAVKATNSVLGAPTINMGRIHGGSQVNIVPDRCRMEVDRRLVPGEDAATVLSEVDGGLQRLRERGCFTGYEIRAKEQGNPFETDPSCALVTQLKSSLQACGEEARLAGASWYSDAGALSALSDEVVVFGPGSILQAHTRDEYIEVDSLRRGTRVLEQWLDRLADTGMEHDEHT